MNMNVNETNKTQSENGDVPIIELRDAELVFTTRAGSGLFHKNKITAVNKVNLKLMPGKTIGIVGESGCGKSTTANIMCGLQQVTSGKVLFKGQDVTHRTAKERMDIGRVVSVVFQDPAMALNARMSVIDQLIDPLVVHKIGSKAERDARATELIRMVGLPHSVLGALPGQLSGALSLNPDAIIADEPTSALDVSVRAQILNLLSDLKKKLNLSMVFISHDIQTIRYISDEVVVMNHGTIVERGETHQVINNPQDEYTKILMGAAPSLLHPTEEECK